LILSPKKLGADIVVHSMTKFISGASNHIAGAICRTTSCHGADGGLPGTARSPGPRIDERVALPGLWLRRHPDADEDKTAACISPGLVRMSIGYTGSTEQRWKQLAEALDQVGAIPKSALLKEPLIY
jgi:cystathionine beta-lyase/cystathionine gamma-synthase